MLVPTFLATFRWGHRRSQSGLGLTQSSVRHTHLALTTQRIGDFLLRGRPRMLWSPSSFEDWGKRGVHETVHQFQYHLVRSKSAADAAHRIARSFPMAYPSKERAKGFVQAVQHILAFG